MEVCRPEESKEEVTVPQCGVMVEVTVLQSGTPQGAAPGVRAPKSSEFGEGE